MHRLICYLVLTTFLSTAPGCATYRKSDAARSLSDYWRQRADDLAMAEAKRAHEMEEAKCDCEPEPGKINELLTTEYTITLERDLEIEAIELDYKAVAEQAKLQEKLDKQHAKAMEDWANQVLAETAQGKSGEEPSSNPYLCGCTPIPDCAQPTEEALAPPPTRPSLGLENLPVVIRARYRMNPRSTAYGRNDIEQVYEPGKQPCLPTNQCGVAGCTSLHGHNLHPAPPLHASQPFHQLAWENEGTGSVPDDEKAVRTATEELERSRQRAANGSRVSHE